jgi:hypothetical protein
MSKMPTTGREFPSLYVTIIRSFRWKEFKGIGEDKFPAKSVFFEIMKKHHCKRPQTVAKHILNGYKPSKYQRLKIGKVLTATQFLKTLQFMRYNGHIDRDTANLVILPLSEWIISRTKEYNDAKWQL